MHPLQEETTDELHLAGRHLLALARLPIRHDVETPDLDARILRNADLDSLSETWDGLHAACRDRPAEERDPYLLLMDDLYARIVAVCAEEGPVSSYSLTDEEFERFRDDPLHIELLSMAERIRAATLSLDEGSDGWGTLSPAELSEAHRLLDDMRSLSASTFDVLVEIASVFEKYDSLALAAAAVEDIGTRLRSLLSGETIEA